MDTPASVNPATDGWLEARMNEIHHFGEGKSSLDDAAHVMAMSGVDTEEFTYEVANLLTDLHDLHVMANISLADMEHRLHNIRHAALYLLSTLEGATR